MPREDKAEKTVEAPIVHLFKAGDVVKLPSGGPNMTVNCYPYALSSPCIECKWFINDTLQSAIFHQEALVKVT